MPSQTSVLLKSEIYQLKHTIMNLSPLCRFRKILLEKLKKIVGPTKLRFNLWKFNFAFPQYCSINKLISSKQI